MALSPLKNAIVGVDVGGTFTDVFVFQEDGTTIAAKSPTTADTVGGVLDALEQAVPIVDIASLSFGSTIATNAVVERRLARVGLLATKGFRDTLEIRRLWRRDLFGHAWNRPQAIVPRRLRLEAAERMNWRGEEIEPLEEIDVRRAGERFAELGVEAVAIAFLFSYLNPVHEQRASEILREQLGDIPVLLSSDVNPQINEYERTSTTAIAAGLAPIVDAALGAVEARLAQSGLRNPPRIMKSNGGVMSVRAARQRPVELVKSGPAGGASAGAFLAERLGEPNLILIDIGGTTADASLIVDGRPARADHDELEWDIPIRVPVVDIRSVGAGGGSIAYLDPAGALRVGPRSAGAIPGPVAYGKGGVEPTVTDAALAAGFLDPSYFLGGKMKLDFESARKSLEPIAKGLNYSVNRAAAAIMHVATVEMASLVRKITVDRGLDPRAFTLVAFGGAGPLFAGALLEELGIRRAIVPPGASTFSAMGGAFADVTFDYRRSEVALVNEMKNGRLWQVFADLVERANADIAAEGLSDVELSTSVDLRYAGQWHEIEISIALGGDLVTAGMHFEDAHERLWGHRRREDAIELTGLRVRAQSRISKPPMATVGIRPDSSEKGRRTATFFTAGEIDTVVLDRDALGAGTSVEGPLIVEEPQTTVVVLPGQRLDVGTDGDLVLIR
jgi:N-methylhydantoinase A